MTIDSYKRVYNKPLTTKDSLNFQYRNGDTLVLIEDDNRNKTSVPYEYKDSTFLDVYKKMAFRQAKKRDTTQTMKYWKDDIKIYFSDNISQKVKKELMSFAKTISSNIDSLNIYRVKKQEDANFTIYYKGSEEYEPKLKAQDKDGYWVYWNRRNQINKAFIKLNPDYFFNDKLRIYKLKQRFIQTLGYFSFSYILDCKNFLSNCYSEEKTLSDIDIKIIKYHYSYGICKGTNLKTFEDQHKRAKESLKKGHKHFFVHYN